MLMCYEQMREDSLMKHPQTGIASLMWLFLIVEADAHDWYTGKTDPVLHSRCCGHKDCHPVDTDDVRPAEGGGYFVKQPQPYPRNDPSTGWWFIPRERVQTAPDDRYHICESLFPTFRVGRFRMTWTCFFAPRGTSSIRREANGPLRDFPQN